MPYPIVDQSLCLGTGDCISLCPEVFEWDPNKPDKARAKPGVDCTSAPPGCCANAIDNCPTGAISIGPGG